MSSHPASETSPLAFLREASLPSEAMEQCRTGMDLPTPQRLEPLRISFLMWNHDLSPG